MAKTKISEYDSTANNNTDVASVNIDEGCAPSGINNAIRAVMAHLKDFQQGTNGDSFNGPVNGTIGATTPAAGTFTTLSTTGNTTLGNDSGDVITINGSTAFGAGAGITGNLTLSSGTANGVAYLNGSKVLTTGSALTFNGTNLGIGTSSPGAKLEISGAGAQEIRTFGDGDASKYNYWTNNDGNMLLGAVSSYGGRYMAFFTGTSGTGTERMRIDSSGNVGIGTSSPSTKLHILNTTAVITEMRVGNSVSYASLLVDGTGASQLVAPSGTQIFNVNGSERARITSGGNFGVGTSNPDSIIDAYRTAGTAQWAIRAANSVVTGGSGFWQRANGTHEMVLRDASNRPCYITNQNYDLTFNVNGGSAVSFSSGGDIVQFFQNRNGASPYWYFNTSGNYGVFSDARLKENVTNTAQADSVEFIKNLQVVEFNWKSEYGDSTRRISGFLAQNVLASAKTEGQKNILTNWETYDETDPDCPKMGLSDHRVIPSVVQTLQAALSQIEAQQAIIDKLKTRLDAANL